MLVDALVALGVLVIVLTLCSEAVQGGLRRSSTGEQVRLAALEARSRLAEVGADIPLSPGHVSGQDGELAWTVMIAPADVGAHLMSVRVAVSDVRGRPMIELASLRAGA